MREFDILEVVPFRVAVERSATREAGPAAVPLGTGQTLKMLWNRGKISCST